VTGGPVSPSKIVCVGRNYTAHAAELGNEVPAEPLIFLKPPSSLIRDGEAIVLPTGVGRVDFEGEIGVVIGRRARKVTVAEAWHHVGGIVPLNDVTARDLQRSDEQWTRAKGFDTFCAMGDPVPLEEVDRDDLTLITRVNGVERQRGHVRQMVFSIPVLLAFVSRIMTLEPGDLLATGTPEGVGPLAPGDEVEVVLEGVGSLRNTVIADREG
jgi:2-keto-4-pentenoate hydratase/2-oxohepta-3-ene-1,7-dioic acid hydratase in catechol pathway